MIKFSFDFTCSNFDFGWEWRPKVSVSPSGFSARWALVYITCSWWRN